jgi:Rhs element Vgr protein
MADSPEKNSEGVIKLTIYIDGAKLQDSIKIVSVEVDKAINLIPVARITVLDGDMPNKAFPVSDTDDFKPGNGIRIAAGYKDDEQTIFEGVVVKHNLKITGDNYSRLNIECRDAAMAMAIGRKNANFIDSTDSDIFSKLVANYSGLSIAAGTTTTTHKEIVQYYCSDWDFLISRAEINGFVVIVDDGAVSVDAPDVSAAVLKVTYGQDLMEFHAEIDARNQYTEVSGVCWDPSTLEVVKEAAAIQTLNDQGNFSATDLAEVSGLDSFRLQTSANMEASALQDWAKSQQLKSSLAKITGRMKFQGSANAKVGSIIELAGVGDRFSGDVFVSAVRHSIEGGDWLTEVEFGLSPAWFAEKRDIVAPPASGLLPGVEGLHIGIVTKLDEDPEDQNRIQVRVPILEADTEGVWARLSNYYASSGFGEFFIPEVGDEVILGYLNNDPSHPVILGSLYSSIHKPPYPLTAENFIKAIVTQSELKVEFDDENKVITITTPGDNKIVISDKEQSITVQDETANKIELSTSGIKIDSPKDIKISAKGDISLDAVGDISLTAKSDLKAAGMNVEANANVGLTVKGGASAELSTGGTTTIKGSMVMIN